MNSTLPSLARDSRERRLRTIRRLLIDHGAIENNDGRVTGCECGWVTPRAVYGGHVAHTDHVASLVADLG